MPNVNDPGALTEDGKSVSGGGDLSDSDFNRMVEERVGKSAPSAPTEESVEPFDPMEGTAEEVRRQVLSPETDEVSVEQGLTYGSDKPTFETSDGKVLHSAKEAIAHERARQKELGFDPAAQEATRAARAQQQSAESQIDESYREAHAARITQDLWDAQQAGDMEGAVYQMQMLRAVAGEDRALEIKEAIIEANEEDPDYYPDDDEIDFLDEAWGQSEYADYHEHVTAQEAEAAMKAALAQQQMAQAQQDAQVAGFRLWAHEQDLDERDPETGAYYVSLVETEQRWRRALEEGQVPDEAQADILSGPPVETLDPKALFERLKRIDAYHDLVAKHESDRAFQQGVMAAETTSVADSIETAADRQTRAIEEQNRLLAGGDPPPEISKAALDQRVRGQRLTRVGDLRRALTAPDVTDWQRNGGLTGPDGKPISVDRATGQDKIDALERELQRARERR